MSDHLGFDVSKGIQMVVYIRTFMARVILNPAMKVRI